MKKWICLFLILIMLAALSACGSNPVPDPSVPTEQASALVGAASPKELVERAVAFLNNGANRDDVADLYDSVYALAYGIWRLGLCDNWDDGVVIARAIETHPETVSQNFTEFSSNFTNYYGVTPTANNLRCFDSLRDLSYAKDYYDAYAPLDFKYDEACYSISEDRFCLYSFPAPDGCTISVVFLHQDGAYYLVYIDVTGT